MATKLSPRGAKIVGRLLLILSVASLIFCGYHVVQGQEKQNTWQKVTAKVTRLEPVHGRRGRISYKAWFSFRDPATNHSYSVHSNMSSGASTFRPGQQVELLYSPENPEAAVANRLLEIYFLAFVSGVIGLTLSICGLALCFGKKSRAPEA